MGDSLKELQSYQDLQAVRRGIWWWILFMVVYLWVWQWPALTMLAPQYTFLLSLPSPGTLISEWWGRDHFFSLFILLFGAVPLTLAFVTDASLVSSRRVFHLAVVLLSFLLSVVMLFFWSIDWSHANDPTADNAYNPANDPRWCCVNFALSPPRCNPITTLNTCPLGLGQSDLRVNLIFSLKFWFLTPWILILIVDFFVIVRGVFERALRRYMRQSGFLTAQNADGEDEEEADYDGMEQGAAVPAVPAAARTPPVCVMPGKGEQRVAMTRQHHQHLAAAVVRQQNLADLVQAAAANKYKGKNSRR